MEKPPQGTGSRASTIRATSCSFCSRRAGTTSTLRTMWLEGGAEGQGRDTPRGPHTPRASRKRDQTLLLADIRAITFSGKTFLGIKFKNGRRVK